ncbi:OsmC-like protein [Meira miltonrushii]|uniref:OsmC-like protein n=1 Tax=Meira miltonrushii TaxID=1280837 RepID=A0A316V771_9BASI|nr:OsmC-like protein [Meira miltonrushii]PWN33447.1 OsmC-like protein [Meira miltonrushii]
MFNLTSTVARPAARSALRVNAVSSFKVNAPRTVTTLSKVAYTAKGQAAGQGRNGKAHLTEEGPFEVKLAMPKSLGGKGDGQNPEQLFALGYASCFLSALNLSAGNHKIPLPANVKVDAEVDIGPPASGPNPFGIAVRLIVSSDAKGGEEKKNLEKATEKAHEICPYSNATRGNVPVDVKVQ